MFGFWMSQSGRIFKGNPDFQTATNENSILFYRSAYYCADPSGRLIVVNLVHSERCFNPFGNGLFCLC